MKKGLGKIRKIKKKHIFLALLAVIVLGGLAKAYSAWVGTTRIAFLNYQAIALGQIAVGRGFLQGANTDSCCYQPSQQYRIGR